MLIYQKNYFLFVIAICVVASCHVPETEREYFITGDLRDIENLVVFSPDDQIPDTVVLEQVISFESNNNVFMEGDLRSFTVDDLDRVYIAATQPGRVGIYVFNSDGEYITRFSGYGRGPGEYESINSIDINENNLYLLDIRLQKFGVFSLEDYSHIKDEVINRDHLEEADSLARILNLNQLMVTNDEEYILKLRMIPRSREFASQRELYYKLRSDGVIMPGKLLETKGLNYYYPPKGALAVPFLMPFNRSKLVSIDKDGRLYTAWSDSFLIKIYNQNGVHERTIYYPVENADMSISEISIEREIKRALEQYELPKTWPVLHTMEVDDEGRMWAALITESDSVFTWWVLNPDGKLFARFMLPGKRSARSAYSKPLMMIKNGYFYLHERDFSQGIDRIVKYKIHFIK